MFPKCNILVNSPYKVKITYLCVKVAYQKD